MDYSGRSWMYGPRTINGIINREWYDGLESFIQFATSHPDWMSGGKIRCPCSKSKCRNTKFREVDDVRYHLFRNGFMNNYQNWILHGEEDYNIGYTPSYDNQPISTSYGVYTEASCSNQMHTMVMDAAGPDFSSANVEEEPPNEHAAKFYNILRAADQDLYPGCVSHSQLSFNARLLHIKTENGLSEKGFKQIAQLCSEICPPNNKVPKNFYACKTLMSDMGLPVERIDCCQDNCMLYWGLDIELDSCKVCGKPRFKPTRRKNGRLRKKLCPYKQMFYFPIIPRLQRLYQSSATAKDMIWHANSADDETGVMRHPADSLAWKHLNHSFPDFASEIRNVRLGLSTDGFQPFGQSGSQYSLWPVILTPYNLPPWMCMKEQYMFLTVLVPGPRNPKQKIDVFLQPLIADLKFLWDVGVETYDVARKQNFLMRAALIWTISDFPAFAMLSGWSTHGRCACPYCMGDTDAFNLPLSRKPSWFDNHRKFLPPDHPYRKNKRAFKKNVVVVEEAPPVRTGASLLQEIELIGLRKVTEENAENENKKITGSFKKKSIFWDLPYWSELLIRHNLDVMHIEKNVFDNVFNTVMNVDGKSKDTYKSRDELNQFCNRPELMRCEHTGKYPKACYTLDKKQKKALCEWIRELKFPDGYVSNMSRCVDEKKWKMFGMKSHDCHVFMQRLLPIALREFVPVNVWNAITELSLFFKELTSTTISVVDMTRLETNIPVILCNLERIFPPSFFDSMEHLPIHLAYEAKIAGPVQYRWMYPFERYLHKLKDKVGNKAHVEASIVNAYLTEEASNFCSHYFEDHVMTRQREVPRNYDGRGEVSDTTVEGNLSIFMCHGRGLGETKKRLILDEEKKVAHTYVLMNCVEIQPYIQIYLEQLQLVQLNLSASETDARLHDEFASWFKQFVIVNNLENPFIEGLSMGPLNSCITHPAGYYVNGYKFHTVEYGSSKATNNSGVCIKGTNYVTDDDDYYGVLEEVVELEYPSLSSRHSSKIVLFKCQWFDTSHLGTRVHPNYKLVEVNRRRKLGSYDPFVFAIQATQVYYCKSPGSRSDWMYVCKVKARSLVDAVESSRTNNIEEVNAFQEDDIDPNLNVHIDIEDPITLADESGVLMDINCELLEEEDDEETMINLEEEEEDEEEEDYEEEEEEDYNDDDD